MATAVRSPWATAASLAIALTTAAASYNFYGAATVSNSTFSGNGALEGGGIYNYGSTATLKNTIVADSPTGGNCYGSITDGGGNLSFPDTTCPGINADPSLGPLQNNGGPTETMALLPGSAAIDAGDRRHLRGASRSVTSTSVASPGPRGFIVTSAL